MFAKSVCTVIHFPVSLFIPSPLCMSKISVLEGILEVFCGQFGGGETEHGVLFLHAIAGKFELIWQGQHQAGVTSLIRV